MLEKDIENLIAAHPDDFFPGEGLTLIQQQYPVKGEKMDILFEDKFKRRIIVEVKSGVLQREDAGQIVEYYGLLKNIDKESILELILCANIIPPERVTFLENAGISCKVVTHQKIRNVAAKYKYILKNDPEDLFDDVSVWIFQGNPKIYDMVSAMGDTDIGNHVHWTVNQHFNKIHKGHLVLLWMSGPEAGIYALARVESEPGMMEEFPGENKYWFTEKEDRIALRVRMSIIRRFVNQPILRETLKGIPELSQLSILKHSQGTNFPVSDSEWMIINQLMT